MVIEKNEKKYEVRENAKSWSIALRSGALSVTFNVSKDICETEEDVRQYVEREAVF